LPVIEPKMASLSEISMPDQPKGFCPEPIQPLKTTRMPIRLNSKIIFLGMRLVLNNFPSYSGTGS